MQSFDRATEPAPACLSDDRTLEARRALQDIFGTSEALVAQKRFSMARHAVRDAELDASLRRLFRERCAFCDGAWPTNPYRFRPTEEAGPSDSAPAADAHRRHLYYTWLTNSWDNIYSICEGCRPREASVFPVIGKRCRLPAAEEVDAYAQQPMGTWRGKPNERPVLLDPCAAEDFRKHLAALPDGRLIALTDRGGFTIEHFNLARSDLVMERAATFGANLEKLVAAVDARPSLRARLRRGVGSVPSAQQGDPRLARDAAIQGQAARCSRCLFTALGDGHSRLVQTDVCRNPIPWLLGDMSHAR